MIAPRILRGIGLALMLSVATLAPAARAADTSDQSLQTELADEIATRLIGTYNSAIKAPPGFETFEQLFDAYQSLRKWQAYLEAIDAAKLPVTAGPYVNIKAAVERLRAASIDAPTLAAAAIEALRGVGDWHADNKAQADIVIQHLGKLVAELTDPRQRLVGQLILAEVEVDSDAPMAAAARVVAAVADIRQLEAGPEQLQLATEFAAILQSLDAPYTLEVASELVAALGTAESRTSLVTAIAGGFAEKARVRLHAAAADQASSDRFARAWAAHQPGTTLDPEVVAVEIGTSVDPLPVLIALAAYVPANARQAVCGELVSTLVGQGEAMRALNLTKTLDSADCAPATLLTVASHFAAKGYPALVLPVLNRVFATSTVPGDLTAAAGVLETLGDVATLRARSELLAPALGQQLAAVEGRAAIRSLLLAPASIAEPLDDLRQAAITAYPPAAAMYALLTGAAATGEGAPSDLADLALFRDVGRTLIAMPGSDKLLAQFLAAPGDASGRLAVAAGYTSELAFDAGTDPDLTSALATIATSADASPDATAVLASIGQLDPASAYRAENRNDLLVRAARQHAWAGNPIGADTDRVDDPRLAARLVLDAAAIEAVRGDFERGVAAIRQHDVTSERIAAFRFVARERARRLDVHDWLEGGAGLDLAPAELVNASTPAGDGPVIHYDDRLNARPSGAALPAGKPTLPDLDVTSRDVTAAIPFPRGGASGIVVGGEGRYVRLGRFDSPYFDGVSNNGVRDYVYEQNRTITPEFIFLDGGTFTIADVIAGIGRDQADAVDVLPKGVVRFNRPIVIGADARLVLSGDEAREIQLNATTGTFIVSAGELDVVGTRLVGFDVEKNTEVRRGYETAMHKFRPFVLGWSGARINMADSEFVALGYSAGRSYGVTLNSGPVDDFSERTELHAPTGIVVNNSFDNLYYGFYTYEAADVALVGNEYRNSIIYGIDPHDRSQRLNISLNTAYGTLKKHGIIISRDVNQSFIVGNLSFDNYGSGTMLDRSSTGTLVFANTLRGNHGDGMAVFESPCNLIGMNDVGSNGRAGIKVRNSWDVLLLQNRITGNEGSAIEGFISDLANSEGSSGRNYALDPYQPVASLSAIGNALQGNGAGIQTAGVSELELYANQFRNQSKRLVAGDLAGLQGLLLRQSERQPTVIAANCRPVLRAGHACPFTEAGLIAATRMSSDDEGNYCLDDAGTAQSQAFNTVQP